MQYSPGTAVTVIAVPNNGSTFSGFSGGGCGSAYACALTITAGTTVTATFNLSGSSSGSGGIPMAEGPNHVVSLALLVGASPTTNNGQQNVAVTLTGQRTNFSNGATTVKFVRVQQPGSTTLSPQLQNAALTGLSQSTSSPPLQTGPVNVTSSTSATVPLTINPAAAAGTYNITVTTGSETVTLNNAFTVNTAPTMPSAVLTTTGSTPPTAAPTSATYRVTMTGLLCTRAITPSDAIYAAAVVRQYDRRSGQGTMLTNLNTRIYGDVNGMQGQRLQAGTRSPTGGIGIGDFIPPGFVPGVPVTVPPQINVFPMGLWQGTLTDTADALVISPSAWIVYGDTSLFSNWNQNEDTLTNSLFVDSRIQNQIKAQALGNLFIGSSTNAPGVSASTSAGETVLGALIGLPPIPILFFSHPNVDRPLGLTDGSSNISPATILPNATVVLTREIIEKSLGNKALTTMAIDFKDTAQGVSGQFPGMDRPGEYTMFIQIERQ
jgi:hypothetical protein